MFLWIYWFRFEIRKMPAMNKITNVLLLIFFLIHFSCCRKVRKKISSTFKSLLQCVNNALSKQWFQSALKWNVFILFNQAPLEECLFEFPFESERYCLDNNILCLQDIICILMVLRRKVNLSLLISLLFEKRSISIYLDIPKKSWLKSYELQDERLKSQFIFVSCVIYYNELSALVANQSIRARLFSSYYKQKKKEKIQFIRVAIKICFLGSQFHASIDKKILLLL